jgi:hypothetical protein
MRFTVRSFGCALRWALYWELKRRISTLTVGIWRSYGCRYAMKQPRKYCQALKGGWFSKLIQAQLWQWLVCSCLMWPGDCSRSRLTALLLRPLGLRALQWSPMNPERLDVQGSLVTLWCCRRLLNFYSYDSSSSYFATDGQATSQSWCRAPIWGPRPDFYYCRTFSVFMLWGAP